MTDAQTAAERLMAMARRGGLPAWTMPEGISEVRRAQVMCDHARQQRRIPKLRTLPMPVDVTEAEMFPNIAAACEGREAEAARQWAAIPDHPADIARWQKGEPINAGDAL